MQITLVRHATLLVRFHGRRFLVDPMLSDAGAMPPVPNAPNPRPFPLVPLPQPASQVLAGVDAIVVTHTHRDHFDDAAASLVPKSLPLFCQPEDAGKLRSLGFEDVRPVAETVRWADIEFSRTAGRHGTGEIGRRMAPVSGFVLRAADEGALYIAGDTIWCPEVRQALRVHAPAVTVANAGAAQFHDGDPITMTAQDVIDLARAAPRTAIVAVHMETVNHCGLTRSALASRVAEADLATRVWIPRDGETAHY